MHSGTAPFDNGPYTSCMQLESIKSVGATVWVSAVSLAGIAANVKSFSGWSILAGLAVLPPLVVLWRWSAPRQTMSESIREARR